jgi:hypothetical protein
MTMTPSTAAAGTKPSPVIIDLGEQSRKRVKLLRKGQGKLLEQVNEAIRQLTASGKLASGAQPVVVVVREEPNLGLFGL